uniref:Uncharacterized protein n=1 Tax=Rhabditophanes sp. KR3021 TaxID=114890 RepID=A0AC35TUR6_9BILA
MMIIFVVVMTMIFVFLYIQIFHKEAIIEGEASKKKSGVSIPSSAQYKTVGNGVDSTTSVTIANTLRLKKRSGKNTVSQTPSVSRQMTSNSAETANSTSNKHASLTPTKVAKLVKAFSLQNTPESESATSVFDSDTALSKREMDPATRDAEEHRLKLLRKRRSHSRIRGNQKKQSISAKKDK